jgi:hypothetical protein
MPRVDTTVEARRVEVARRYLRGEMQSEIAASFGVSQVQISYDLKAIRAAWLQSAIRDFDAARAEELAKIDHVESEYWQAWDRSKKDKETENLEGDGTIDLQTRKPKVTKVTKRKEGQSGNPAYLQGILTCIERRCKILGLDAPTRFNINWDELTPEQEERLAKGEPPEKVLSA